MSGLAGTLLLLSGCGPGPVQVPVPQPDAQTAQACAALAERLPRELEGEPRRRTEPTSDRVTAWGSPPIVVRCGVAEPEELRPTSRLTVVNGVEWFSEPDRSPVRFTTVDRTARVELAWPREYGVPAGTLVELAAPVKDTVPERDG